MAESNGIASTYDLMYHFSHFLNETNDTLTSPSTSYRNSITAYTNSLAKYIWNKCGNSYTNSAAQYVPTKSYILDNFTYSYNSGSGIYTTFVRIKNEENYSDSQAVKIEDISYGTIKQGYSINSITFSTNTALTYNITYEKYFPTKSCEISLGQINIYADKSTTLYPVLQNPNLVYGYCRKASNNSIIEGLNLRFVKSVQNGTHLYAYINIDYNNLKEYDAYAYVVAKIPTTLGGTTYAFASRKINVKTPTVQTISKNTNYSSYFPAHNDNLISLRLNYPNDAGSGTNINSPIFSYIDFQFEKNNDTSYSRYSLDEAIDNLQISTNSTGINVIYPFRIETTNLSLFDVIKKKKFGIEKEGFSLHTYIANVYQVFDPNSMITYTINNIYSYEYPTSISISYSGTPLVNINHKFKLGVNPGTAYGMDYTVDYDNSYFDNFSINNIPYGSYIDSFLKPKKSGVTNVEFKVFTNNYNNYLSDTKTVVIHYSLYNNLHFTTRVESCYKESSTNDTDYFASDTLFIPHNTMLNQTIIEMFYLKIPYTTESNGESYFMLHVNLVYNVNYYATIRYEITKPDDGNTVSLTKINNDEYGEHSATVNKEIRIDPNTIKMYYAEDDEEIDSSGNEYYVTMSKLVGTALIGYPAYMSLQCIIDENNIDFKFRINYGNNSGSNTGSDEEESEYVVYNIEPSLYSSNQVRLDFICSENVENITILNIRCDEHMDTTSFARINDLSWYMTLHTTDADTCRYYVEYRINNESKTYNRFVSISKIL